ncbi:MAG: GNAT family N-acetyltransferase [Rhodoglobus sp.]
MVSYRDSAVDTDAALALLTEYFSFRRESFPATMGEYKATFPTPEDFVLPHGVFLVVEGEGLDGDAADVGCGGIRQIEPGAAGLVRFEVKHLWIRPFARGGGLGRALLAELERRARELGAEELVLDTNDSLDAAGSLYRSTGFTSIAPYNDNPNATTWYGKVLAR